MQSLARLDWFHRTRSSFSLRAFVVVVLVVGGWFAVPVGGGGHVQMMTSLSLAPYVSRFPILFICHNSLRQSWRFPSPFFWKAPTRCVVVKTTSTWFRMVEPATTEQNSSAIYWRPGRPLFRCVGRRLKNNFHTHTTDH